MYSSNIRKDKSRFLSAVEVYAPVEKSIINQPFIQSLNLSFPYQKFFIYNWLFTSFVILFWVISHVDYALVFKSDQPLQTSLILLLIYNISNTFSYIYWVTGIVFSKLFNSSIWITIPSISQNHSYNSKLL